MEVTPHKRRLCVIGCPVSHSKSPLLHSTMITALGLDAEYLCQPVSAGELPAFLRRVRAGEYDGFNATMPHKEALLPLLDVVDAQAAEYGSVNTVCNKDGKLYGYNTDGPGFLRALAQFGLSPSGKRITVLGAGGAAKAVTRALCNGGASHVTVCNRTREKAEALAHGCDIMSTRDFDSDSLHGAAEACDILVNCTNLGMNSTEGQFESLDFLDALPSYALVCDLIYAPLETAFLARARMEGHVTMNGLPLLFHQAILSLEYFAGVTIDAGKMYPILEGCLSR